LTLPNEPFRICPRLRTGVISEGLDDARNVPVQGGAAGHQFNFSGEKAIARYAAHWKIDAKDVDKIYDFYALDNVRFAPVKNVDGILGDAKSTASSSSH